MRSQADSSSTIDRISGTTAVLCCAIQCSVCYMLLREETHIFVVLIITKMSLKQCVSRFSVFQCVSRFYARTRARALSIIFQGAQTVVRDPCKTSGDRYCTAIEWVLLLFFFSLLHQVVWEASQLLCIHRLQARAA